MTVGRAFDLISTAMVAVAAVAMVILFQRPDGRWNATWVRADVRRRHGGTGTSRPIVSALRVPPWWLQRSWIFHVPYCKDLLPVLDSLRAEFPGEVVIEFHHFPLKRLEFTNPSAVAAECAQRQGRFCEMFHTLYAQMDSVGVRPWGALAAEAGVPDLPGFQECIQLPQEAFGRVAAGREFGERIRSHGHPENLDNGELFHGKDLASISSQGPKTQRQVGREGLRGYCQLVATEAELGKSVARTALSGRGRTPFFEGALPQQAVVR